MKKIIFFGALPFFAFIFFALTGYHYIPVEWTVGRCMMDYSSPLTYQERLSPLNSSEMDLGHHKVLVCYGSPSAKGRKIFGDLVAFNQLWRMGANEPTRLYTDADIVLGDLVVPKGRYSLYAIPGKFRWEIFVNKSTLHWGNNITPEVREEEIGSFEVAAHYNLNFVEDLTIDARDNALILSWEKTMLRIPVVNFEEDQKGNAIQQYLDNIKKSMGVPDSTAPKKVDLNQLTQ